MTGSDADQIRIRRQRRVAMVLIASILAFVAGEGLGARLDIPGRWMALFELAVLAAMTWAIWETVAIWRARRGEGRTKE